MKKKMIIGGIVAAITVAVVGTSVILVKQKNDSTSTQKIGKTKEEELGIKYVDVPNMDQVYINGQVQPERSQAFNIPAEVKAEPVLKVTNGQVVEVGTVLYTIEDTAVTSQLEENKSALAKQETRRQNIIAKWNRAITQFNQTKEEERTTSKSDIDSQYQEQIDGINEEKQSLNELIASLSAKRVQETKAEFKGKISIPEVKEANTPIVRLISEQFFVVGTVNEKDLEKIKPEQKATLTVVSNGNSVSGHISAIDLNPANQSENGSNEGAQGQSMAQYKVKIAIDELDKVKNGFHVQAAVSVGEETPIMIPKEAIHNEGDTKYVLVNDFGSIIRRTVVTGEEKGSEIRVITGVESGDRVIVSSKEPVHEGDILSDTKE